jgi:hypothetical protein
MIMAVVQVLLGYFGVAFLISGIAIYAMRH